MFERYTEKARRSLFFARYEASQFGSPWIESEHLLLALARENKTILGPATPIEVIRKRIEAHVRIREKFATSVDIPLSHECKRILAYGAEEAERLQHTSIETDHLLLGVLREERCLGAEILREAGLTLGSMREKVAATAPQSAEAPARPARPRPEYRGPWFQVFAHGDETARQVYQHALAAAGRLGSPCLETKHLLLGLLETKKIAPVFALSGQAIREAIKPEPPRRETVMTGALSPTEECRKAMAFAMEEAAIRGDKQHSAEDILFGLMRVDRCEGAEILRAQGFDLEELRRALKPPEPPQTPEAPPHV